MMTSPCSLNRSMTFSQSWQNGWRQSMKWDMMTAPSLRGGFLRLSPRQTKLQAPLHKPKAPAQKRKAQLLKTFWRRFWCWAWPKCPLGYPDDGVITKFCITVSNWTFLCQSRIQTQHIIHFIQNLYAYTVCTSDNVHFSFPGFLLGGVTTVMQAKIFTTKLFYITFSQWKKLLHQIS